MRRLARHLFTLCSALSLLTVPVACAAPTKAASGGNIVPHMDYDSYWRQLSQTNHAKNVERLLSAYHKSLDETLLPEERRQAELEFQNEMILLRLWYLGAGRKLSQPEVTPL